MAYEIKTWKDRDSMYRDRRLLTPIDGSDPITVDVSRSEGLVYEDGDAVDAHNLNTWEARISSAFSDTEDLANTKIPLNGTSSLAGSIVPASNNTLTLGTTSNKFNNVHATTFTGALSGNATTATRATSADRSSGQTFVINNAAIQGPGGQSMLFQPQAGAVPMVRMGVIDGGWRFHPASAMYDLGHPSAAATWVNTYLQTAPSIVSDENEKNSIEDLDIDLIKKFVMGLEPVSYKLNFGTSGRRHYGLSSQRVRD